MDISHKYAQAFFNIYGDTVTSSAIKCIERAAQFLRAHRRALFLFKVPVIDRSIKQAGLVEFCDRFQLGDNIERLAIVLLHDKRASLLAPIFEAIVALYKKRNSIVGVTVASSCALTEEQRSFIEAFIARHVVGEKNYRYTIDTSLIAGIRVYSDTFLWEFSIAKQLRDFYHSAIW